MEAVEKIIKEITHEATKHLHKENNGIEPYAFFIIDGPKIEKLNNIPIAIGALCEAPEFYKLIPVYIQMTWDEWKARLIPEAKLVAVCLVTAGRITMKYVPKVVAPKDIVRTIEPNEDSHEPQEVLIIQTAYPDRSSVKMIPIIPINDTIEFGEPEERSSDQNVFFGPGFNIFPKNP